VIHLKPLRLAIDPSDHARPQQTLLIRLSLLFDMHTSKKMKTEPAKPDKPTNLRNIKDVGDPSEAAETRYSLRPRSTTPNYTNKTKSTKTKSKAKAEVQAIKLPRGSYTAEDDTSNHFGPSSTKDDFYDSGSKGRFEEKMAEKESSSSSSEPSSLTPSPVMMTIEAVPLDDFNERQSERTNLLKDLKKLLGDEPIPPTFWACSQLADTQCLKILIESIINDRPLQMTTAIQASRNIVKQCKSSDFQSLLRVFGRKYANAL
jgi:hypothetical protein